MLAKKLMPQSRVNRAVFLWVWVSEMIDDGSLQPLIAHQKWKLWIWGVLLAVAGLGFLMPDRLGAALAIDPSLIDLGAVFISFVALVGASLSIRCPQCGLSLAWYGLSHKDLGGWLSWLLSVGVCPRCGFQSKAESIKQPKRV